MLPLVANLARFLITCSKTHGRPVSDLIIHFRVFLEVTTINWASLDSTGPALISESFNRSTDDKEM